MIHVTVGLVGAMDGLFLIAGGIALLEWSMNMMKPNNQIIDAGDGLVIMADLDIEAARLDRYMPFVKKHGMIFPARKYPSWMPTLTGDRCYDAAYVLASHLDLTYCEGFKVVTAVDGKEYFIGHAWCYDENLGVIDPTGASHQNHSAVQYAGVAIKRDVVRRWYEHTGYHGVLDGLPDDDSPPMFGEPPELWDALYGYRREQCSDQ